MSIRAAILGPTGYTGLYLIQTLLRHPEAQVSYLASHREELPDIREIYPQLSGRIDADVARCRPIDFEAIAKEADVVFLGLPHKAAMSYIPGLLDAGLRVIDLSADYRLKDPALYKAVYGHDHGDTENLADAVYGLPEIFGDQLPGAMLVANPGCYPTAAALAIAPLLENNLARPEDIQIAAASGVTGAGRTPTQNLHFAEQNEAFMAYGTIGGHRHQPEIVQTLQLATGVRAGILFVPHLLPTDRGIHETIFLDPTEPDITEEDLYDALTSFYEGQPFIRVRKELPNIKFVRDTNFCDIAARLVPGNDATGQGPKIVLFSTIDNMYKGASGQAVQNMNRVFEIDETLGLL